MSVAVLGLGQMGLPVAAALAGQGVQVFAYDPENGQYAPLEVGEGATPVYAHIRRGAVAEAV